MLLVAQGSNTGAENGDNFLTESNAFGDQFLRKPVFEPFFISPTGLGGRTARDYKKMGVVLSAVASVTFFDVGWDGIGTGDLPGD